MAFASTVTSIIALLICENIFQSCISWVFLSRPETYKFIVPPGVYKIRVLAMGAGGRGAAGNGGGGGSGRLRFWELNVQPEQEFRIHVGGTPIEMPNVLDDSDTIKPEYNQIDLKEASYYLYYPVYLYYGVYPAPLDYNDVNTSSSFGNYTAAGGEDGGDWFGGNGGTGGGSPTPAFGEKFEPSRGGSGGSGGDCIRTLSSYQVGSGQLKRRWHAILKGITQNKFAPLSGGAGGTACPFLDGWAGGGGGGGLMFIRRKDNFEFEPERPITDPDRSCGYGEPGWGYGYGGGAGGMMVVGNIPNSALEPVPGSDGGRGFVYVEWD